MKHVNASKRYTLNKRLYEICKQIGVSEPPRLLIDTREVKDLPKEWNLGYRTTCYKYEAISFRQARIIFLNLRKIVNMKQAVNKLIQALVLYRWPRIPRRELSKRIKFILSGKQYPTEEEQRHKREEWKRTHQKEVTDRKRRREQQRQRRYEEQKRRYEKWQRHQHEAQEQLRNTYPWDVLEIAANSTKDVIKAAYRRLCHIYHPDKNLHRWDWANEKFRELTNAYNCALEWSI